MYRFMPRSLPGQEPAEPDIRDTSAVMRHLLSLRGCTTPEQREAFLHPEKKDFLDPFLLHDMKRAVERIEEALRQKEKCVVYGDYDADGVTAAALLVSHLRSLGMECGYYIPDRHFEGYGLHEESVRKLAQSYSLMITVDCGITSVAETALAKSLGMDVIVTDHHLLPPELPDAPCVNAHIPGYPFEYLAGVGVAFKLVQALSGLDAAMQYADLAAIGTICDIVNLTGENRLLAVFGLEKINAGPRPGIRALLDVCGYAKGRTVDADMISFGIGPKINAGGRIGHNAGCVGMLLEKDYEKALATARLLITQNQERQSQETGILREAIQDIETNFDFLNDRIIVAKGDSWNPGVIGIVASRLVERYHFPVILLAREGDTYTGSGRSIPGVHILNLLHTADDLLIRCGGHEMACGLKIAGENIGLFTRRLQDGMADVPSDTFIPSRFYETELPLERLDRDLVGELDKLKPFGMGNPAPVFLFRDVKPVQVGKIGKNEEHLRMKLTRGDACFGAVSFRDSQNMGMYQSTLDVLAVPEINAWMNREEVQLRLCGAQLPRRSFLRNLEAQQDAVLQQFLNTLSLENSEPAGFRKDLPIRDTESGCRMFANLCRQSLFGTILVVNRPEDGKPYLETVEKEHLQVDCTLSAIQDAHIPYNRIVPGGLLYTDLLKHYRNILLCDGSPDPGYVERLAKAAPHAVIYAPRLTGEMKQAIRAAVPDMEMLRSGYRVLQRQKDRLALARDFDDFYGMFSENLPLSRTTLHLALCIFRDGGLAAYRSRPFRFALLQPPETKVDLTSTQTMRYLERFR
ncbi:MAG: single-stranded-DNA-specific exonuclease RecJ [Clostridia bacterium]|nr:single-stranded-DNA-specific exonuclease RecJ [Clostridia bacterium]